MTFLEKLIMKIQPAYLKDDYILDEIIINVNNYGEFLNKISNDEDNIIECLAESIYDYSLKLREYNDYIDKETLIFQKRDNKTTPGKTRIAQNINILKKARDLLQYVSSKDYRNMQGHHSRDVNSPPMEWQKRKGKKKYKDIKEYNFTNYQDKEVALKAYNQTINLYSQKYPYDRQYRVEKDIFNTYWFLTSLIQDLESKEFYLFEKTEYYPPEKPSKKSIKTILRFIGKEFNLNSSLAEKEFIDNLNT